MAQAGPGQVVVKARAHAFAADGRPVGRTRAPALDSLLG
jgi:hypothetical protein